MDIDFRIDKPILNRATPEENIAVVDTWIASTADKINYIIEALNERSTDGRDKSD